VSGAGTSGAGTLHVRVEGRVQGVGFRRFADRAATALGLAGWARNLSDGAVEVLAVGPIPALETLRERLADGPPYAAVARVVDQPPGAGVVVSPRFVLLPDADPGAPAQPPHVPR
jgi:acylphosphatase